VAVSDASNAGVLIEAAALRLPVPERLSVVGFGDLNFAADLEPCLTSVRVDAERIDSLAAAASVGRLHGEPPAQRVADVGFNIVQRGTARRLVSVSTAPGPRRLLAAQQPFDA
jgi:LacI family gluconate utilization system Gnt-I transcriptional repressor